MSFRPDVDLGMEKNITKDQITEDEKEFKLLQFNLGLFFKQARKNLGLTIEDFANTYEYALSQYREYENGKANPTLLTIYRLLKIFGLSQNDLFNFSNNQDRKLSEAAAAKARKRKVEQLREQVEKAKGREFSQAVTDVTMFRIFQTLVFCGVSRSKAEILENFELKNTTNNFRRSVGIALELSWIKMTNPESRNSPEQRYVITEEGKRVV